jgi:hypothetical protein
MGRDPAEPTEPAIPDLISTDGVKTAVPSLPTVDASKEATETASRRHILPKNLRHAVRQLSDGDLDELVEVAFDEAKQRGRLPLNFRADTTRSALRPSELTPKQFSPAPKRRQAETAEPSLTRGQVITIRAAFKAGIKPSQIARQFGVSQSSVRKALAADPSK